MIKRALMTNSEELGLIEFRDIIEDMMTKKNLDFDKFVNPYEAVL
jgi:hypothetical protein